MKLTFFTFGTRGLRVRGMQAMRSSLVLYAQDRDGWKAARQLVILCVFQWEIWWWESRKCIWIHGWLFKGIETKRNLQLDQLLNLQIRNRKALEREQITLKCKTELCSYLKPFWRIVFCIFHDYCRINSCFVFAIFCKRRSERGQCIMSGSSWLTALNTYIIKYMCWPLA